MKSYNVAIVGATGAVGHEFLKLLDERNFPLNELTLLASSRSAGKKLTFQNKEYTVAETTENSFDGIDIALFAGGQASKLFAHAAVDAGAIVVDNSSTYRYDPEIPLVVPEVNPEDVKWHKGIIANPNCSTIIMVTALKPLHDAANIKRIVVSTYQAVSGAGMKGIVELDSQVNEICSGKPVTVDAFNQQIAFNVFPQIDVLKDDDYYKEEMKMVWETQKMFHNENIGICATAVRVPVYRSHSESINIETEQPLTPEEARAILEKAPGVTVQDDPANGVYPMPLETSDKDDVYVGRIRKDISCENGLVLWVASDQIRKGAALNTIQIAELLIKENLV